MRFYIKLLNILLLVVVITRPASAVYQVIGDFSDFDDKPVVPLWRGTHFSPDYFLDGSAISQYANNHGINVPIYCDSAHRNAKVPYTASLTPENLTKLNPVVNQIQGVTRKLEESGPIKIDGQVFHAKRDAFQQKYTNSTNFISSIGKSFQKKYKPILEGFPEGNPLLSFSTGVKHAALYSYGMKNYGKTTTLDPEYDDVGKPANQVIGYLQCVLLTDDVAKKTMPYNVVLNHANEYIKVKTYSSCNILAENEVSLVGMVPPESVVMTMPLRVPDFSKSYEQYGYSRIWSNKT